MKVLPALTAASPPLSLGHFSLAAARGSGTYLPALLFPNVAVAMFGPHEGVGDFVPDGVQNRFLSVSEYEVDGKFDGATMVDAKAQRSFAAIEGEGPLGQAILNEKALSQCSDFSGAVGKWDG